MKKVELLRQLLATSPFLAFRQTEFTKIRLRYRSKYNIYSRFGYQWSDAQNKGRKSLSIGLRNRLRQLFDEAIEDFPESKHKLNYASLRAEAGKPILHKIVFDILSSDLLFFDVTHPNANVFFELGIAYAASTNLFLLRNESGTWRLPSDLAGLTYIDYRLDTELHMNSSSENDIKRIMRKSIRQKMKD